MTAERGTLDAVVNALALEIDQLLRVTVEIDREDDGRWIAEVVELPGLMAYGNTREDALDAAQALARSVLADRRAHGEPDGAPS